MAFAVAICSLIQIVSYKLRASVMRVLNCPFILITATCGFLVALESCSQHDGEPSAGGRRLSEWVTLYASTDAGMPAHQEAENAIQQIGTNAIPCLLNWISQAKPPPPGQEFNSDAASLRAMAAPFAFSALGAKGETAIPALTRMLNEGDEFTSAYAAQSLGRLGTPALPSLIAALKNSRADVRKDAADFMIFMGTNALPAIPALEKTRNDPDPQVREAVSVILGVLKRLETKRAAP